MVVVAKWLAVATSALLAASGAVLASEGNSADPCDLRQVAAEVPGVLGVLPLAKIRACIDTIKVKSKKEAIVNARTLKSHLQDIYAFGDIAIDSDDSDATEAPYKSWTRYSVKSDYENAFNSLISEIDDDFSLFEFHSRVAQIYDSLRDAHTTYQPRFPFYYYRPVYYTLEWDGSSCDATYRLHSFAESVVCGADSQCSQLLAAYEKTFVGKYSTDLFRQGGFSKKVLKSVNGKDVKSFLLAEASYFYQFKDEGARLNALIAGMGAGVDYNLLHHYPEQEFDEYVFDDGTNFKIPIGGVYRSYATGGKVLSSTEELKTLLEQGSRLGDIHKQVYGNATESSKRRALSELKETISIVRGFDSRERKLEEDLIRARSLTGTLNTERYSSIARLGAVGTKTGVPVATLLGVQDTPVFRLTTFNMEKFQVGEQGTCGDEHIFVCVIKLFYKSIEMAKKSQSKKLIIDVSQNGGGLIFLGNLLVFALNRNLDTVEKLQDPTDFRLTDFWKSWLDTYGSLSTDISKARTPIADEDLKTFREDLPLLSQAFHLLSGGTFDMGTDGFTAERVGKMSDAELRAAIQTLREEVWKEFTYDGKVTGWGVPNSNLIGYDTEGKRIQDVASYLLNNVQVHRRGGKESRYTPKYYAPFLESLYEPGLAAKGSLTSADVKEFVDLVKNGPDASDLDLIVVSDGTCGSTCSLFITKLLTTNTARIVTYGGLVDQALDSSSFSGGAMIQAGDFFEEAFRAYAAGYIVSGGKILPKADSIRPVYDQSISAFTFQEVYASSSKNSLPYEFYHKPGHYHIPFWHPLQGSLDIYQLIVSGKFETLAKQRFDKCGGAVSNFTKNAVFEAGNKFGASRGPFSNLFHFATEEGTSGSVNSLPNNGKNQLQRVFDFTTKEQRAPNAMLHLDFSASSLTLTGGATEDAATSGSDRKSLTDWLQSCLKWGLVIGGCVVGAVLVASLVVLGARHARHRRHNLKTQKSILSTGPGTPPFEPAVPARPYLFQHPHPALQQQHYPQQRGDIHMLEL